jgi:hypothetical protein
MAAFIRLKSLSKSGEGEGIRTLDPNLGKGRLASLMVRAVGVEPTLCHQNWILSPARLPIPPRPQFRRSLVARCTYSAPVRFATRLSATDLLVHLPEIKQLFAFT